MTNRHITPLVARHAIHLLAAAAMSACGGGGGGGDEETAVEATPRPILLAEAPTGCADASTCQMVTAAFLDNDGTVSVFLGKEDSGASPRWRAATLPPGATALGPAVEIPLAQGAWWTRTVDLGNKRFAVVETNSPKWKSRVVDLSVSSSPTVSSGVVLPVDYTAQMVSTQFDGAYIVGPHVAHGPVDMGGGVMATGTPVQMPVDLNRLYWGRFERLWGASSAWWAFNATGTDGAQQSVHLGLVDLQTGDVRRIDDRAAIPWSVNASNYYSCQPTREPYIEVGDYGQGQALVGWIQRKAYSNRGCDIVADGVTLTGSSASGYSSPVLGGSAAGPVVLWQEHELGATDQTGGPARIVWRSRDPATGTWGATNQLSTHPYSYITGQASAPQGLMAISWAGCEDSVSRQCTNYLTKFVRGQWQTVSLGSAGPFSSFNTLLDINIHGDGIAVWNFDRCTAAVTTSCARVYAQRF